MMKPKRAVFLRKFGRIIGYLLLFSIFCAGVYWGASSLFAVTSIEVIGTNIQVQVDQRRLPKTLLLFPTDALRDQLLHDNPILADIQFRKKYPHTLVIVAVVRSPIARLETGMRDVYLDANGIVLSDADASLPALPRIVIPLDAVRIGETIQNKQVVSSLAFLRGMHDIAYVQMITKEDDTSLRARLDKLDILFPQDASTQEILTTLQTLLTGFRIKGTLPTFIDLRFNKPIIKF